MIPQKYDNKDLHVHSSDYHFILVISMFVGPSIQLDLVGPSMFVGPSTKSWMVCRIESIVYHYPYRIYFPLLVLANFLSYFRFHKNHSRSASVTRISSTSNSIFETKMLWKKCDEFSQLNVIRCMKLNESTFSRNQFCRCMISQKLNVISNLQLCNPRG